MKVGDLSEGLRAEVVDDRSADGLEGGCDGPYFVLEFERQVTEVCEYWRGERQDDRK